MIIPSGNEGDFFYKSLWNVIKPASQRLTAENFMPHHYFTQNHR